MSAAAVLRSAGADACRALRPTAARFRRILDANKDRQPLFSTRETIITPRRHYTGGGGGVNTKQERPAKELAATGRISMKLDEASDAFDTHNLLLKQLLEDKIKYERLKRVLVRIPIFVGIAYCMKQYFSGGSGDEEAKKMD